MRVVLSCVYSQVLILSDSKSINSNPEHSCRICQKTTAATLIDFGPKPRCFDFLSNNEETPTLFDFSVAQCRSCGVIQLKNPIPAKCLHPKFDWIRNKEPDKHSDLLAKEIMQYLENDNSKVLFLSLYDKKLYDLINEHVGKRAYLLNPSKDLGINQSVPGQALIPEKIIKQKAKKLSGKFGNFDLIVTCRLLEHTHDTHKFVSGITQLLKPSGRLVIEVPDSTKSLLQGDVAMLWEEHTSYFTPESLKLGFSLMGFRLEKYIGYHYPQEDALIGIFHQRTTDEITSVPIPMGELTLGDVFVKKIEDLKSTIIQDLNDLKRKYGKIVIFGAGHRTVMFINLLEIASFISHVIDDDEKKQGLKLPSSRVEIHGSDSIVKKNIGVCLLSVNIEIEEKIKDIVTTKAGREIQFFSISPDSKNALPVLNAH